jgi:hypothetical protein
MTVSELNEKDYFLTNLPYLSSCSLELSKMFRTYHTICEKMINKTPITEDEWKVLQGAKDIVAPSPSPSKKTILSHKTDKNFPKKPSSSYIIFCNEKRPSVKEANPDLGNTELASKMGEMWKAMTESEKAPYVAKAQLAKQEFQSQVSQYNVEHGIQEKSAQPKRPPTAYVLFCADERQNIQKANPEMTPNDVSRELGRIWGVLDPVLKDAYKTKAKEGMESNPKIKVEESNTPVMPARVFAESDDEIRLETEDNKPAKRPLSQVESEIPQVLTTKKPKESENSAEIMTEAERKLRRKERKREKREKKEKAVASASEN